MKRKGQLPSLSKLEKLDLIKKEINFNRRKFNSNMQQRKKSNNTRGSVESRGNSGSVQSHFRTSVESRQRTSVESRKSKFKKKQVNDYSSSPYKQTQVFISDYNQITQSTLPTFSSPYKAPRRGSNELTKNRIPLRTGGISRKSRNRNVQPKPIKKILNGFNTHGENSVEKLNV